MQDLALTRGDFCICGRPDNRANAIVVFRADGYGAEQLQVRQVWMEPCDIHTEDIGKQRRFDWIAEDRRCLDERPQGTKLTGKR